MWGLPQAAAGWPRRPRQSASRRRPGSSAQTPCCPSTQTTESREGERERGREGEKEREREKGRRGERKTKKGLRLRLSEVNERSNECARVCHATAAARKRRRTRERPSEEKDERRGETGKIWPTSSALLWLLRERGDSDWEARTAEGAEGLQCGQRGNWKTQRCTRNSKQLTLRALTAARTHARRFKPWLRRRKSVVLCRAVSAFSGLALIHGLVYTEKGSGRECAVHQQSPASFRRRLVNNVAAKLLHRLGQPRELVSNLLRDAMGRGARYHEPATLMVGACEGCSPGHCSRAIHGQNTKVRTHARTTRRTLSRSSDLTPKKRFSWCICIQGEERRERKLPRPAALDATH